MCIQTNIYIFNKPQATVKETISFYSTLFYFFFDFLWIIFFRLVSKSQSKEERKEALASHMFEYMNISTLAIMFNRLKTSNKTQCSLVHLFF